MARERHRFRYWLAENFLNSLQDVVMYPVDVWHTIRSYLLNRFVYETHLLRAHAKFIRPGSYCDYGDSILVCVFSAFERWVNTVGIEHFEWAMHLRYDDDWYDSTHELHGKLTEQAEVAREVIMLYWWWLEIRATRTDTDAITHDFWTRMHTKYGENDGLDIGIGEKFNEEERAEYVRLRAECEQLESGYTHEDTAMLTRLIAVRNSLWY